MTAPGGATEARKPELLAPEARVFRACARTFSRLDEAERSGAKELANFLRERVVNCGGRTFETCPHRAACRTMIPARDLLDAPKPPNGSLAPWSDGLREIVVDGSRCIDGLQDRFRADDPQGNIYEFQQLSLDILHDREIRPFKDILAMWMAKKSPSACDFDAGRLERAGYAQWIHVLRFDSDHVAVFERFASALIPYAGGDHTGAGVLDYGVEAINKIFLTLNERLTTRREPIYGVATRTINRDGVRRHAVMHRLEVPLFQRRRVSGSMIFLIPQHG